MSSYARPADGSTEHTGSVPGTGRENGGVADQASTRPFSDLAATPIYDELAARFDLARGGEGEQRLTGTVDVEQSAAATADEGLAALSAAS